MRNPVVASFVAARVRCADGSYHLRHADEAACEVDAALTFANEMDTAAKDCGPHTVVRVRVEPADAATTRRLARQARIDAARAGRAAVARGEAIPGRSTP